ncbi:hypothetical protein LMG28727_06880 [Paraburkholderia kirstenboschensis]|uniref:hypothetical protein n=1 Tax=Paraburkholderia kirstenboschensis TaxID=1245436 RepID=UPI000A764A0E|nr:hypothetical protein [Paraburkholderia kirstenboschensis]CAD6559547.1 hypothetical protein LMG28727_06880 [Paraburkholderia kirstenboschensis]
MQFSPLPIRSDVLGPLGIAVTIMPLRAFSDTESPFSRRAGGIDVMKPARVNGAFEETARLKVYEMELARATSHIASTLHEHTMLEAVAQTIQDFQALHGRDDLREFALALSARLEQRGRSAAARVLQSFAECGNLPDAVPKARHGPVPAPLPGVRKRARTRAK